MVQSHDLSTFEIFFPFLIFHPNFSSDFAMDIQTIKDHK